MVTALFGGCKFQVSGPTAAFVVVLAPILTKHGMSGLLTAGALAGLLLVAMGLAGLGRLIYYIPQPVTSGFTVGIATVIATLQLKDLFGLQVEPLTPHFIAKLFARPREIFQKPTSKRAIAACTSAKTSRPRCSWPRPWPSRVYLLRRTHRA